MRCVAIGWLSDDAFVFVKVCKLYLQNHTHEMTTLRCDAFAIGWLSVDAFVFVKSLQVYAPQTKILEGKPKDEMHAFDVLVKGVST